VLKRTFSDAFAAFKWTKPSFVIVVSLPLDLSWYLFHSRSFLWYVYWNFAYFLLPGILFFLKHLGINFHRHISAFQKYNLCLHFFVKITEETLFDFRTNNTSFSYEKFFDYSSFLSKYHNDTILIYGIFHEIFVCNILDISQCFLNFFNLIWKVFFFSPDYILSFLSW
jgi:hypothetical protein